MRRYLLGLLSVTLVASAIAVVAQRDLPVTAQAAEVAGGGVISVMCPTDPVILKQTDPIINPGGGPSAHLHNFVGGVRAADALDTSPYESEKVRAGDTTCRITQDTAAYWFPPLFHKGTGEVRAANQVNAYYRSPKGVDVTAWPADFSMVAGIGTANVPPSSMVQEGVSWSCKDSGPFSDVPIDCDNVLIGHVHFPDCQLADGSLAYGGNNCVNRFPRLSMHIRYNITNGSRYALDPGVTGLHADFWNTWDQATLEGLVENCLDNNLDCKVMSPSNVLERCKCVPGEHPEPPLPSPSPEPTPAPPDPEAVIADIVTCLDTDRPLTCIKQTLRAAGYIE